MNAIKFATTAILVLLVCSLPARASSTKVYFSPLGGCTAAIVQEVGTAKSEI